MLTVENLQKSYGDKTLFANVNCIIRPNERIGLIGVNGTGKSSFLKIVAQIDKPDSGVIKHSKDYTVEYLAQEPDLDYDLTVFEQIYYGDSTIMKTLRAYERALQELKDDPNNENAQEKLFDVQQKMDESEAWEASAAAKTILTRLGVTQFNQKVSKLSGGQKKRVALAKALIQPADLLILDEPTNHLDNETIQWLESYLTTYKGALLLVTHDRYFLNRVTNRIFELDQGHLYEYEGNYEMFLEKKAEREALEQSEQQKHQNLLRRELAWLKRGARARSTKQRARVEKVEQLQNKKFQTKNEAVSFQIGSTRLGNQVIELTNVVKKINEKVLIHDFSYLVKPGDRIGIIGPNGSGKTTLLNMMADRMAPDSGEINIGETVKIGYYTQEDEELDGEKRIIDYIKETAQVIYTKDNTPITAEQMLEHFLFSRRQQWTYIRKLSGGEKRRLYLLKVLMTEPNVLFLDELTNDLDTQTLSVLEEYLNDFPGVVITVSHDRYFLDRVVDQLFVFSGHGHIHLYYGNYSEFLLDQTQHEQEKEKEQPKKKPVIQKQTQRKRLSYKEQQEWNVIEDEIMELEMKIEELQEEIAKAGSDFAKVQTLYEEQQQFDEQLEYKMDRWEELSLLVEEMKK